MDLNIFSLKHFLSSRKKKSCSYYCPFLAQRESELVAWPGGCRVNDKAKNKPKLLPHTPRLSYQIQPACLVYQDPTAALSPRKICFTRIQTHKSALLIIAQPSLFRIKGNQSIEYLLTRRFTERTHRKSEAGPLTTALGPLWLVGQPRLTQWRQSPRNRAYEIHGTGCPRPRLKIKRWRLRCVYVPTQVQAMGRVGKKRTSLNALPSVRRSMFSANHLALNAQ